MRLDLLVEGPHRRPAVVGRHQPADHDIAVLPVVVAELGRLLEREVWVIVVGRRGNDDIGAAGIRDLEPGNSVRTAGRPPPHARQHTLSSPPSQQRTLYPYPPLGVRPPTV